MLNNTYIIIGKIGATFGVKGWIKVNAYTEYGRSILQYRPWYIQKNQTSPWVLVKIEASQMQGKHIIVKFVDIHSPEQAKLLTGSHIGILRSQLPNLKENEYYWSDLIGLTVINKNGQTLGKVTYMMETGSNDVLVVKGKTEIAIPYLLGTSITRIDLGKKEIHVDWELN